MTVAYYNEIDRYCCDWLSNLMDAGHITPGKIDDRDIREVQPEDLAGFERVHFFSGLAGWEHALNLAGWSGPVWTGSCPCQPFSIAGQGRGADDERHLWPAFYRLIAERAPSVCFGEQIASKLGRTWLAAVRADLEDMGYAVGGADLCAAGVGAPHIRQRLWWVADADQGQRGRVAGGERREHDGKAPRRVESDGESERGCEDRRLAHADGRDAEPLARQRDGPGKAAGAGPASGIAGRGASGGLGNAKGCGREQERADAGGRGTGGDAEGRQQRSWGDRGASGLGDALGPRLEGHAGHEGRGDEPGRVDAEPAGSITETGPWDGAEFIPCSDGKARPALPGIFPLASRIPARVAKLRAAGNSIVPQVAAAFIRATMQ